MKIYIIPNTGSQIVSNVTEYFQISQDQFINMFFRDICGSNIEFISDPNIADINICGIQTSSVTPIFKKPTILLCVENCSVGRTHYNHYNEFDHYNDSRINIYIYNDISRIEYANNYIAIPFIYVYIDYFNYLYKQINFNNYINYSDKKFALFISRNSLNSNKQLIINKLNNIGQIDNISQYNIYNITCYHHPHLLHIFNMYKFIICFENSITDGYITEKIFNVFLSKSIPIYNGAPNICDFINKDSFINFEDTDGFYNKIKLLSSNENEYNNIINSNKISDSYNNENWNDQMCKLLV
jgi:hypothetical protein